MPCEVDQKTGMTVYVVWDGYDDILGLFSDKETAERAIALHMEKRNERSLFKCGRDQYSISAHILDSADETA